MGRRPLQGTQQSPSRLDELEAFVATAEGSSFTAAAAALGRDATVLSRRVSALEARLGVRLLNRTTRRVTLTEAGSLYLRRVSGLLVELAAAEAEVMDRADAPRGTLRLTLPASFGRLWIAPLLPAFLRAYPGVAVEASYADRFADLVAEGWDAAIRIGGMPDSTLVVRRLAPSRRLLVASPAYLAAHGAPTHPDDLARHVLLGFTGLRTWPHWVLQRGSERAKVRISGRLASDDGEALVPAALDGMGLMLAADWLVGLHLAAGRLVEVLGEWSSGGGDGVSLVLPPGRLVPAKTRILSDWLAARLGPTPPWRPASAPPA